MIWGIWGMRGSRRLRVDDLKDQHCMGGTGHGARGTGHRAQGTGHGARGTGHRRQSYLADGLLGDLAGQDADDHVGKLHLGPTKGG